MGKLKNRSLHAEFYAKIVAEIQDERIESFKAVHLRYPTLPEESDMYDTITPDEVKARMQKLYGGYVDPNFSLEIGKYLTH